jgi:Fe-S cluster assembly ATP-binding protein
LATPNGDGERRVKVRGVQDLLSGLVFVAAGVFTLFAGRTLAAGSISAMGAGAFPTALGVGLVAIGLLLCLRSLRGVREALPSIARRPVLAVSASIALFVLLLPRAGKRSEQNLMYACAVALVARWLDGYLLAMPPEDRAREGIFLAFQYPVEIPGVSTTYFLKAGVNAIRKHRGLEELDAIEFLAMVKEKMKLVEMDQALINRPLNEGFSGGEKKRNEIFQMGVLDPKLAILDETDSGLDIDALKVVAEGINALRSPQRGILLITHYQRLLNYVKPDFVHVMVDGRIVRSGKAELALELEAKGYQGFRPALAPAGA